MRYFLAIAMISLLGATLMLAPAHHGQTLAGDLALQATPDDASSAFMECSTPGDEIAATCPVCAGCGSMLVTSTPSISRSGDSLFSDPDHFHPTHHPPTDSPPPRAG